MMRSASRQALDALHEQEQAAYGPREAPASLSAVAGELYAVADLLVGQPRLRRTLGDPAATPKARTQLADRLLSGKVGPQALALFTAAAGLRWSSPWDLVDALETAGDDALFAAAENDGQLETVEDELFRLERLLESEGQATSLLDEAATAPERRVQLLDALIERRVTSYTLALLRHAVASTRKRTIMLALDELLDKAAQRKERSIARVLSAVALTDAQEHRLATTLTHMYGRPVTVRSAVEPSVRGGLVVRIGDEVIDGSIAARFAQARIALTG